MANYRIAIILFLALMPALSESGWWSRRRRCSSQDCVWNEWGLWSECDKECGGHGTQIRERNKRQSSSCGGRDCSGDSKMTRNCNRLCYNGGFLNYDGTCRCRSEYSGVCCERHTPPATPKPTTTTTTTRKPVTTTKSDTYRRFMCRCHWKYGPRTICISG